MTNLSELFSTCLFNSLQPIPPFAKIRFCTPSCYCPSMKSGRRSHESRNRATAVPQPLTILPSTPYKEIGFVRSNAEFAATPQKKGTMTQGVRVDLTSTRGKPSPSGLASPDRSDARNSEGRGGWIRTYSPNRSNLRQMKAIIILDCLHTLNRRVKYILERDSTIRINTIASYGARTVILSPVVTPYFGLTHKTIDLKKPIGRQSDSL